jgi:hypothetical protein
MTTTERHRLLEKRRKLAALADRGVDGEREVAKAKLRQFDDKHPGLGGNQYGNGTISANGHVWTHDQFAKLVAQAMVAYMRHRFYYRR